MRYFVTVGTGTFEVELDAEGVRVEGRPVEVDLQQVGGTEVRSLLVDGRSHRLVAWRRGQGRWELHLGATRLEAEVVDERLLTIRETAGIGAAHVGPRPVRAPMPGLVVRVEVAEGEVVEAGQGVVVVEAMKMENELRAEGAGVVSRVLVAQGDTVERDQLLIELEAVEEPTAGEAT